VTVSEWRFGKDLKGNARGKIWDGVVSTSAWKSFENPIPNHPNKKTCHENRTLGEYFNMGLPEF
jgi:hypothetical protein